MSPARAAYAAALTSHAVSEPDLAALRADYEADRALSLALDHANRLMFATLAHEAHAEA